MSVDLFYLSMQLNAPQIAVRWQLVALVNNDIRARRGNACVRICSVTRTAELQDRAPLQAQSAIQFWLDRESSYKRLLSWHRISWRLLPLKSMLNDYSRCVVI